MTPSSLVVFPFKHEDPDLIGANFDAAARHERVREVWGVAAAEGALLDQAASLATRVSGAHSTPVRTFPQERLGSYRSGKGDGMNTAIRMAARRGFDRTHFYDADITNFDERWIDGAERAADLGHAIVRHRFPRASTDAMITWMVTRPALAMTFPGTLLPRIGQPLGGEFLIDGSVATALASDKFVVARSDWGIDTIITHATATLGTTIYEHNLAEGKRHALYGSLDELRTMLVECLDAARSLRERPQPDAELASDPMTPVPEDLKGTVAYDIEQTMRLLISGWTGAEVSIAEGLPEHVVEHVLRNQTEPHYRFMDTGTWGEVLVHLLDRFVLGDGAWESLAFRLWLMRVLAYTTDQAQTGYDTAIDYLESTIVAYEELGRNFRGAQGSESV